MQLSDTDQTVMQTLLDAKGGTVTREMLCQRLGYGNTAEAENLLSATVYRLRRRIERATPLPLINGDATQLRQVIHNLVQNGLDAVTDRPDGHVSIITSVALGEHGELRAVRLTIIDNGPGFADKVLKRAFEPYVTTKAKGTGLGLAVVKKIADEHGARLRAANVHVGDETDGPVTGARVSLSFSNFAVAPAPNKT